MPKVGRNDPCPCGSGKKYKQCHLPIEEAAQAEQLRLRRAVDTLMPKIIAAAQDQTLHQRTSPPNAPKKLEKVPRPARTNPKLNRRSDDTG